MSNMLGCALPFSYLELLTLINNNMMKTILRLFSCLLILLFITGFSSCGDDEPASSSIVGKWYCASDSYSEPMDFIMCFLNDGTGYCYWTDDRDDVSYFDYQVDGNKIKLLGSEYWLTNVTVTYKIYDNNKRMTMYGLDDNDLEKLDFERIN